ncbi:MAG: chemotaxis protein CheD [Candidatus Hermodarchaeota archaeon]
MVNKIKSYGKIDEIDRNGEIFLPIGHYTLINCKNKPNNTNPKISIYGLGSCIALILFDCKNKVSGMSHILLPKAQKNKKIEYPHKYADLSVKLLVHELVKHGAMKENIKGIIIGGSKIFDLDENFMGIDNIQAIKLELAKLNINILKEHVGGKEGRAVIFDTKNFTVLVKLTSETSFTRLQ